MKMIGAAAFKTHCLRIMKEVQETGEAVTVTHRGKPIVTVQPRKPEKTSPLKPLFGALKHPSYSFPDPFSPVENDWEEALDRKWDQFL